MRKASYFVLSCVLSSHVVLVGCGLPAPKKYSTELVRMYAELLVMHEREKIAGNATDSLYQTKVRGLFTTRKINEEEFQKRVAEISRDDIAWRSFLSEATALMDSIKATKPN